MDFKGWIGLADGTRCHPLTIIDDHFLAGRRRVTAASGCSNVLPQPQPQNTRIPSMDFVQFPEIE